jgi:hypothetical protein
VTTPFRGHDATAEWAYSCGTGWGEIDEYCCEANSARPVFCVLCCGRAGLGEDFLGPDEEHELHRRRVFADDQGCSPQRQRPKSITADKPYRYSPIGRTFYGVFEGLGNTITNFTITRDGALFQRLCYAGDRSCIIRDVGMIDANIHGDGYSAPLVVDNEGTIENCFATGVVSVTGNGIAGGLVSGNIGVIRNSYSNVAVSGVWTGGIAGVVETFCNGDLCEPGSLIVDSYSLGPVSGYSAGGLVGYSLDAAVVNSYALGPITNSSDGESGGLVGLYSTYDHAEYSGLISSYSSGAVTGGTFVGGLIGNDKLQMNINNNYWNLSTSGVSDPSQGAGNIPNDPGITGLKDKKLKRGLPAGFDPAIWAQSPGINNGYPYLIANPPP